MLYKNLIRNLLGIFIVFVNPLCYSAESHQPLNFESFSQYAEQARKDWLIPGMAVAIVKDNKIIFAQGYGQRDASGAPVTTDSIFDIASLTKSFTAALLALQIDEKKYSWDTKVLTVYPAFKLYDEKATNDFEIRDLLAHHSGLPSGATDDLGNFGYNAKQMIHALRFIKPVSSFRTEFAYENIFSVLAKEIIQKVSQKKYTDLLHEKLWQPLQMNNTYVVTEKQIDTLNDLAQPFFYFNGKVYPYKKDYPYISRKNTWALENGVGSGGINSSANDMAKWIIFNMNQGAIGKKQLISAKKMNFIHTPQTPIKSTSTDINLNDRTNQSYGEGWFINQEKYKPYTLLYHTGGGTGMHALMAYIPEKKIGIVILTNTWGNKVPEALYQYFFDLYLHGKTTDWSKIYLHEKNNVIASSKIKPTPDNCVTDPKINLKKYIGTYQNSAYGNIFISPKNNYLILTIGPQKITWKLTPCGVHTLKADWPNPNGIGFPMIPEDQNKIKFTLGKNHKIQKMTIPFINDDGTGVFFKKENNNE